MRKSNKSTRVAASNNEASTALATVTKNEIAENVVIDNTTGETVQPEATEAKPDPRAARAERIAADRADVAKLYAGFEATRQSVPVKALSAFKLASTTAHPIARNVSQRQCAALAVAFAVANKKLATGATAPRVFDLNGKPAAIENGVLRDAVSSGLCTVSGDTPESEIIKLSKTAAAAIAAQLGSAILKQAGIAA